MGKIAIRFWIGIMIFMTTYINYTTRVNLAVSIIAMTKGKTKKTPECIELAEKAEAAKKETESGEEEEEGEVVTTPKPSLPDYGPRYDWNERMQGQLLGSYFMGYIFGSLFGGAPSEWWGPRRVVFLMEVLTMIFNSACVPAAKWNEWVLYALRFVIGFFAGFIYPALQALIATWAPPAEKGKFVAALMGNTLGTCVTWPLVGFITSTLGWEWGFHCLSIQIAVFCVIWWFVVADSPAAQRCISADEVDFITSAQGGKVSSKKRKAPYLKILLNFPFWMLVVLHSGNLWGLYLQLQGVPKFMSEVVGFNLKNSGILSAVPHLARLFMGTGFGTLGDFLKQRNVCRPVVIRKSFVLLSHVVPGLLLIAISFCGCNWIPILTLLVFSMSINGAAVMTNLQNPQDLAPNFSASIFGIISFLGGMTGFVGPAVSAELIKNHNGINEWGWIFIIGGTVYIASGVIFILFGSVEEQSWNSVED